MQAFYFAVTGRFHGDDEATTLTVEGVDRAVAVAEFKSEMCALRNLEPEEIAAVLSDNPQPPMQVYIDAVLFSESPIHEC